MINGRLVYSDIANQVANIAATQRNVEAGGYFESIMGEEIQKIMAEIEANEGRIANRFGAVIERARELEGLPNRLKLELVAQN